ncbi:MAG: aldolase catalytic domain-containing protein [Candidimonas sp.]|nr:aldolase catalytic domain-containing protein [Candidimonas sp.]
MGNELENSLVFLDCTLRDGGYYNNWDFPEPIINQYLQAMAEAGVDYVELGLRSLQRTVFKGACAYTTDEFIRSLRLPECLQVGVMINASELIGELPQQEILQALFPNDAQHSPVRLVRIASHVHEFSVALPAVNWLKQRGFKVGLNLMQIADRSEAEIKELASQAAPYEIDVLYFADSMGSMAPKQTAEIVGYLRTGWKGPLGIHTHDNLGLALSNTLCALDEGATWVDATVTGMGRGPGNARTEEVAIEIAERRERQINLIPLMQLIQQHFKPMQQKYGWGTNPYYYLAGKYGIHPSYVQQMQGDSRFSEEDVLAVINYLRKEGGKKFSLRTLDAARHFYHGEAKGTWSPEEAFCDRDVLILGTGPGVANHRNAIERYIEKYRPLVVALNTQTTIAADLISYRVACHPVRLLADCQAHTLLPQPLIVPFSMLPEQVQLALEGKEVLDFGLSIKEETFGFSNTHAVLPTSMVIIYALAVANCGKAKNIYLAGFDGYSADDPRNREMDRLFDIYRSNKSSIAITSITPSRYKIPSVSVYSL